MMQDCYEDEVFFNAFGMRVWQQRHEQVIRILQKHQIRRVFDLGCAEGLFIQRLSRGATFTQIVGIDIDRHLLTTKTKHNLTPELLQDTIKYHREAPLKVSLFHGDLLKPNPHLFLQPQKCAITLIEVIEHIDQYKALTDIVFGLYQPEVVIITTPNKEFNFYFGLNGVRHWDHRFEWTRKEFEEYCEEVKGRYGYGFEVFGVGSHKNGEMGRGRCTQGAVFYREKEVKQVGEVREEGNGYQEIVSYDYPFWKDTLKQDIVNEIVSEARRKSYQDEDPNIQFTLQQLLSQTFLKLSEKAQLTHQTIFQWISQSPNIQLRNQKICFTNPQCPSSSQDQDAVQ